MNPNDNDNDAMNHASAASEEEEEEEEIIRRRRCRRDEDDAIAQELERLKRAGIFATTMFTMLLSVVMLPWMYSSIVVILFVLYCLGRDVILLLFYAATTQNRDDVVEERILEDADNIHPTCHDNKNGSRSLEEIQHQIRYGDGSASSSNVSSSSSIIPPPPKDGIYEIVYAADYYGKALRTEGKLALRFSPPSSPPPNNGWEIAGQTYNNINNTLNNLGKPRSIIHDGFLNAQGEMYWTTSHNTLIPNDNDDNSNPKMSLTIYYGSFDFANSTLREGDFYSNDGKIAGRIIRVSLLRETTVPEYQPTTTDDDVNENDNINTHNDNDWASCDIEMITKTRNDII